MAVVVLSGIGALATQYLYGGLRVGGQRGGAPRTTKAARVQLSVIAAVLMLLIAASYWLDRFSILTKTGRKFAGASFTDVHAVIPSKAILAGIAIFVAVMFIVTAIRGNWRLPAIGVGLMVVAAVAVGGVYPAVVQRFQVQPNQQDAEAEFIGRNIDATLDAYDLQDVEKTEYDAEVTAEAGACAPTPTPRPRSGSSTRRSSARRSSSSSRSVRSTTSPTRCRSTGTRSTGRAATP